MTFVEVHIWSELVGVLVWDENTGTSSFEYDDKWRRRGIELSPLIYPRFGEILNIKNSTTHDYSPKLAMVDDRGLPLFISDSMPDSFGSAVLSRWLEKNGKLYSDLNPVERLTYIGSRGMGAIEFHPAKTGSEHHDTLNLDSLKQVSESLLNNEPVAHISDLGNLFLIGTSPGGAQPKVLIDIDQNTGDIYRGDNKPTRGRAGWMLKFNRDSGSPLDFERGVIEYAYYRMAVNAGINIMESDLKQVAGQRCFMTKRFDRVGGDKVHTQTLHAMAGMNFRLPDTYSYEQVFSVLNQLGLPYTAKEQLFRIMVFNVAARNVDDHTKNLGFLMDQNGAWQMAPAYDLTFTYNENYNRPTPHFLSIGGRREKQRIEDVLRIADEHSIKKPKDIFNEVNKSVGQWSEVAKDCGVSQHAIDHISRHLNTLPYTLK